MMPLKCLRRKLGFCRALWLVRYCIVRKNLPFLLIASKEREFHTSIDRCRYRGRFSNRFRSRELGRLLMILDARCENSSSLQNVIARFCSTCREKVLFAYNQQKCALFIDTKTLFSTYLPQPTKEHLLLLQKNQVLTSSEHEQSFERVNL